MSVEALVRRNVPVDPAPPLQMQPLGVLKAHCARVWHLAWNPVLPNLLASCGADKRVFLWSCGGGDSEAWAGETWRVVSTLEGQHDRAVRHVSWSPNGTYLACASFDGTVSVWQRDDGEDSGSVEWLVEGVLDGHENEVKCVEWLTDSVLVTASRDRNLWIWERVEEGEYECGGILSGHQGDVKYGLWSPPWTQTELQTPAHVVSCSYDGTVRLWRDDSFRQEDWHCVQTLRPHGEGKTVWCAAFQQYKEPLHPSEEEEDAAADATFPLLCTAADDWSVAFHQYDTATQRYATVGRASGFAERSVFSVDWAPQGLPLVAVGSGDNRVTLIGLHADAEGLHPRVLLQQDEAHEADVNAVAFSPLTSIEEQLHTKEWPTLLLATAGDDYTVRLWRVQRI